MEVFRREQDSNKDGNSPEPRATGWAREVGAGINLQALEHTPPNASPNVSPATYFGIRQHHQAGVESLPARVAGPEVNTVQTPDPGVYGAGLPAKYHPGMGMANRGYMYPGHPAVGMPDARERKLALQTFDEKELYYGISTGFIEWGKECVLSQIRGASV